MQSLGKPSQLRALQNNDLKNALIGAVGDGKSAEKRVKAHEPTAEFVQHTNQPPMRRLRLGNRQGDGAREVDAHWTQFRTSHKS